VKTSEVVSKYLALSQVVHAAGGDQDPVAMAMYNAGYSALAAAVGGQESLNGITAAYAKAVGEGRELPEEDWPKPEPASSGTETPLEQTENTH
jgi:hypothetical protein